MSQYTSYYLYQKYVSYDNGESWVPVYPEEYSISGDSSDPQTITKKQDNDPECGYTPPVIPQYRWVQDGDNYICDDCYCIQYLTFRALEDDTFSFSNSGMSYSLDSGSTWNTLTASANTPTVQSGSTIMWKATLSSVRNTGIGTFSSSGSFEIEGNVMSLKYGDNFSGQTTITSALFNGLFHSCTGLTSAENLVLPATTLKFYCYRSMFADCTSLVTPPVLPATTLATDCYSGMFNGCTSLTTAPELPATTLANYCYETMFYNCTSLTTAPSLPATTLTNGCYRSMFYGCNRLSSITCLATDISAEYCTHNWVYNVASSGTFYKNPSMNDWSTGDNGIPYINWTVQDYQG